MEESDLDLIVAATRDPRERDGRRHRGSPPPVCHGDRCH
jgi:hypothetical protein